MTCKKKERKNVVNEKTHISNYDSVSARKVNCVHGIIGTEENSLCGGLFFFLPIQRYRLQLCPALLVNWLSFGRRVLLPIYHLDLHGWPAFAATRADLHCGR